MLFYSCDLLIDSREICLCFYKANAELVSCYQRYEPLIIEGDMLCVLCSRPIVDPTEFVRLPMASKASVESESTLHVNSNANANVNGIGRDKGKSVRRSTSIRDWGASSARGVGPDAGMPSRRAQAVHLSCLKNPF
jgi:hypothetical protein